MVALKFKALLKYISAYLQFKFCSNRIDKKNWVKTNFQNFYVSVIFYYAYRLNCQLDLFAARLALEKCLLVVRKESNKKQQAKNWIKNHWIV